MSTIGERAFKRYVKMPPAGSGLLQNADPIDAATVTHATNNVHVLENEMLRPLAHVVGFPLTTFTSKSAQWAGLTDTTQPSSSGYASAQEIPWDPRTSLLLGPFDAINDLQGSADPQPYGRTVRLRVEFNVHANATTHRLVTQIAAASNLGSPFGTVTELGGTGKRTVTVDATKGVGAYVPRTCRLGGSNVSSGVYMNTYYVRVGWAIYGASAGTSYLLSVSAWEIR